MFLSLRRPFFPIVYLDTVYATTLLVKHVERYIGLYSFVLQREVSVSSDDDTHSHTRVYVHVHTYNFSNYQFDL